METENRLIAEFMGFELQNSPNERWFNQWFTKETLNKPYNSRIEILHFDTDWNWLMEVVEKIESLGYRTLTENECFMITKNKLSSFDVRSKDDYSTLFSDNYEINHYGGSKKENVYNACIEFIKWYNKQK